MFTKENLPTEITPCPIAEAVFELRYSSNFPIDAVFGIIYQKIQNHFQGATPKELGTMQLPPQVRKTDKALKYQAYYSLHKDSYNLNIGPDVLVLGVLQPYVGWSKWFTFIQNILNDVLESGAVNRIERVGLRYINIFNEPILENTKVDIKIDSKSLVSKPIDLRTEIQESGFTEVLQIGNKNIITEKNKKTSIIDIACLYPCDMEVEDFKDKYKTLIEDVHNRDKFRFFNLLKPEYLNSLNPSFEQGE